MGDDLHDRPVRAWCFGRRTPAQQCGANPALSQVKALPEPLQRPLTPRNAHRPHRRGQVPGTDALQQIPQTPGGHTPPTNRRGGPDAERPPATRTPVAVAAEYPQGPQRFSSGVILIVTVQTSVTVQRADPSAMRTRRLFQSPGDRIPFRLGLVKPSLITHSRHGPSAITEKASVTNDESDARGGV